MDKSWVHLDRSSDEYSIGLNLFINESICHSNRKDKIICPCKQCCNRYYQDIITVKGHLLWNGMDPMYMTARWTHHGETYINSEINTIQTDSIEEEETGEMYGFLNESFVQPIIGENVGSSRHEPIFEGRTPEAELFYKLLEHADKELYPGCKNYKKLDAVVKLYQIKCLGNVTNSAFSMFMEIFSDMLPDGNCLPKSSKQAKRIIDDLGLKYEKIDACPNDCMLFWKDTSNLDVCSRCGASRYTINKMADGSSSKVSAKILRYFPLTPRLKRLYMSKHTAEHMRWHVTECPKDGYMRHPSDSPAWKHLDDLYPEFASEVRNVRLGLASDGFNPFASLTNPHSTWPVVISVYNLPPWMCMKQPYFFLSLLIPGPTAPGNDIDVYLKPLIDELKELWEVGSNTYDVFSNQSFNMKAAVLWTINDFPAYANLSGWSTKGKLACPHCNHKTCSKRLPNYQKHCYLGHRRFLPIMHRFRNMATLFDGSCERNAAPRMPTGSECLAQLSTLTFTFGKTPTPETDGSKKRQKRRSNVPKESRTHATNPWKKKSIFFSLPYWQHLLIRHNLDLMHIEKCISEKILQTLLGSGKKMKDGLEARADLEVLKIRRALHPIRQGNRTYLPPSIFSMTSEEKMLFCEALSNVRVPDGYSSNVSRCVNVKDRKLCGLKSHDHHVIMQHLLPLAIRRILPRPITLVFLELSAILRRLCSKKESEASFKQLENRVVLALCQMEKMLPLSFFDITVHLLIHLAHEAAIAGPIQYRWMYPIERYLQTLKKYVRNKNYPEGSICVGYLADEAVSFCSMYLSDIDNRRTRLGRNADISTPRDILGGLSIFASSGHCMGKARRVDLQRDVWEQCHLYVLFNCPEVSPFLEKSLQELRKQPANRRKTIRELENLRNQEFPSWFRNCVNELYAKGDASISPDLRRLAYGPNITVQQYRGYLGNGCRFRIKLVDDNKKNQNCGVFVSAQTPSYSSQRDPNPVSGDVNYYGVLTNVYKLDYRFPGESDANACKVVLFDCDWVSNSGKKVDQYGFTLVNFNRLSRTKDKFMLASQAIQVFYVPDPKEKDWNVVVKTPPRDFFDVMEDDDESSSLSNPVDDYYTPPNLDDPSLDNEEVQIRTDIRGTTVNKQLPLLVEDDSIVDEVELEEDDEDTEDDSDEDREDEINF